MREEKYVRGKQAAIVVAQAAIEKMTADPSSAQTFAEETKSKPQAATAKLIVEPSSSRAMTDQKRYKPQHHSAKLQGTKTPNEGKMVFPEEGTPSGGKRKFDQREWSPVQLSSSEEEVQKGLLPTAMEALKEH